jgi:hypothetical protein
MDCAARRQGLAGSAAHPQRASRVSHPPSNLVLDVHLELRLRAEDSSRPGAVFASDVGDTDHSHDLVAALLSGALQCLNRPRLPEQSLAPGGSPPRPGVFRREGEFWMIAAGGRSLLLKDMKGLRYLARLLADPDREFHALDLVRLEQGSCDALPRKEAGNHEDHDGSARGFGDAGELLDSQAKRAYRQRLATLRDELDEAGDPELVARLRAEMDMIAHELAGAMGLGGRDVKAACAAERARLNVTNRIKAAISKIATHDPALGRHFDSCVRTGTFCSYRPEPDATFAWST